MKRFIFISLTTCFPFFFLNAQTYCDTAFTWANQFFSRGKYEKVIDVLKDCDTNSDLPASRQKQIKKIKCESALALSDAFFEKGKLNEVVNMLEGCTNTINYSKPVEEKVLNKLSETYQFLNLDAEAIQAYADLLYLDPFFQPNSVNPEARYLHNKFETFPSAAYTFFTGINFLTKPVVTQQYTTNEVIIVDENYKPKSGDLLSWVTGISADINLFDSNVFFSTGYFLSSNYFRYNGVYQNALDVISGSRDNAMVSFIEKHRWSTIPLALKLELAKKQSIIRRKIIPFVYGGVTLGILHKESAQLQFLDIDFENLSENPTTESIFSLEDRRTSLNFGLLLGAGLQYRFKRFYVVADLRYHRILNSLVKENNRYNPSDLSTVLNYVDNDFQLRSLGVSVGTGFFLFKSTRKSN